MRNMYAMSVVHARCRSTTTSVAAAIYLIENVAHQVVLDTDNSSYIIHDEMQNKYEMR